MVALILPGLLFLIRAVKKADTKALGLHRLGVGSIIRLLALTAGLGLLFLFWPDISQWSESEKS